MDGWEHFARADWAAARDAFAAALEHDPDDPDALDGLGQALWWMGERDAGIDRRREAYAAFRRRGDARGAGRIAVYLAGERRIDGAPAEAAGWMSRARRLLGDLAVGPEHGWLAIEEAKRAPDPVEVERCARAALAIAHELDDPDVECMALAQLGRGVVRQGRVSEGMELIDEGMTVALGGETTDPLACGDACCTTLVVCDGLADLRRATEWCEAVVEFTERRRFIPVQSWCRGIFAGVLVRAGEWERAEGVLEEALRRPADRRRGAGHELPLAVLAELRLRQGRVEEAARLLEGVSAPGPRVRLALARGELDIAAALADDELAGEVLLASGDPGVLDAAARLRASGESLAREDLVAESVFLRGRATGSEAELSDAVERFAALRYPWEEGRARLELARVQAAAGSPLAVDTARAARDGLERLGALADADRAAALLRSLGAGGRSAGRGARDELTVREREVLGLIAEGLSNGEIADRLVIAPKTAEHHVGRVLAKLGVRSRAEAAAHAVREGL